jgi:hypothetical protein
VFSSLEDSYQNVCIHLLFPTQKHAPLSLFHKISVLWLNSSPLYWLDFFSVLSRDIWVDIIWYMILYYIISYHIISYHIISYHIVLYYILFYFILFYFILFYLTFHINPQIKTK